MKKVAAYSPEITVIYKRHFLDLKCEREQPQWACRILQIGKRGRSVAHNSFLHLISYHLPVLFFFWNKNKQQSPEPKTSANHQQTIFLLLFTSLVQRSPLMTHPSLQRLCSKEKGAEVQSILNKSS